MARGRPPRRLGTSSGRPAGRTRRARLTALALAAGLVSLGMTAIQAVSASEKWATLFADEPWYRDQPGPEREFRGLLEVRPDGNSPGALQRRAFYRLGERGVYTGAARLDSLDALAGSQVVIRGKAVDMHLEGALVREIWPASVRSAP